MSDNTKNRYKKKKTFQLVITLNFEEFKMKNTYFNEEELQKFYTQPSDNINYFSFVDSINV